VPNLVACSQAAVPQQAVLLATPNTAVRSMLPSTAVSIEQTSTLFASTLNTDYPCAAFFIVAENVTIENYTFDLTDCVTSLLRTRSLNSLPTADIWLYATPVVGIADSLAGIHLTSLTLTGGGDAVARLLSFSSGTVLNLDNAQFYNIVGNVNTSSPLISRETDSPFGIITSSASGNITRLNAHVASFGGPAAVGVNALGSWLGAPASTVCVTPVKPHVDPEHCSKRAPDPAITIVIIVTAVVVLTIVVLRLVVYVYEEVKKVK
jgi:hypothetical protein